MEGRGFELKMQWARKHLERLDSAVTGWLNVNADAVGEHLDPQSGERVITIEPRRPAACIALIATDCVHSLRATLDQLVYALAWAHTHGPLTKQAATESEFLIFGRRAPTAAEISKRIGAIHPDAQAVIQRLQPHHRGDAFASHELWVLDQLWNLDKHRDLPLTVFATTALVFGRAGEVTRGLSARGMGGTGPVRQKTEVLRYTVQYTNVDMKDAVQRNVALDQGSPAYGQPVVPLLTRLVEYIDWDVLAPLTPFLKEREPIRKPPERAHGAPPKPPSTSE